jgi:hypothetical protein
MLRKLIALAITSGLVKKAYDIYKEKNATAGVTDVTARKSRSSTPTARAKSAEDRPSAS